MYAPKTWQTCTCRKGVERDNCPQCEGTGQRIDFAAIRARVQHALTVKQIETQVKRGIKCTN